MTSKDQQKYEKMCDITNHQGNANQKHNVPNIVIYSCNPTTWEIEEEKF